ncbi:hypothetical protein PC116_g32104 [Phytophthora cactorum]|nr:hypothetical protein PC116_g32104 [Phytophthora cactorum]
MVISHPIPMAFTRGWPTIPPTQLNMFRTKLLRATPLLLFRGMNSVSIVVAALKTSMLPTPKKKLATDGAIQWIPYCNVQPDQINAPGYNVAEIHAFSRMRSSGRYMSFPLASYLWAFSAARTMIRSIHRPPSNDAAK